MQRTAVFDVITRSGAFERIEQLPFERVAFGDKAVLISPIWSLDILNELGTTPVPLVQMYYIPSETTITTIEGEDYELLTIIAAGEAFFLAEDDPQNVTRVSGTLADGTTYTFNCETFKSKDIE